MRCREGQEHRAAPRGVRLDAREDVLSPSAFSNRFEPPPLPQDATPDFSFHACEHDARTLSLCLFWRVRAEPLREELLLVTLGAIARFVGAPLRNSSV